MGRGGTWAGRWGDRGGKKPEDNPRPIRGSQRGGGPFHLNVRNLKTGLGNGGLQNEKFVG